MQGQSNNTTILKHTVSMESKKMKRAHSPWKRKILFKKNVSQLRRAETKDECVKSARKRQYEILQHGIFAIEGLRPRAFAKQA